MENGNMDEFDPVNAMTEYSIFDKDRVHEELENDRIDIALLLTATMAEGGLKNELIHHLGISHSNFDELCGGATLGYFIGECNNKNIIDKEYREAFQDLRNKRNAFAHDIGYRDELIQDDKEAKEVRGIIEKCCDWFDSRPSYPR
jgi:hypothetical protein